ncbi:MAG: 2-hydroxychromene-2-carboxylate isomerase [Pseudomonadota bacterium]
MERKNLKYTLEFWFEFGSPYSYLSIMRIEALEARYGVTSVWKPFLLGPLFTKFGWKTSPFNIYPIKGKYMWRDMERRSKRHGIDFQNPTLSDDFDFPQNGVAAARLAILGLQNEWGRIFCKSVFKHQFADGLPIADFEVVARIAVDAGASERQIQQAVSPENKLKLRSNTELAAAHEIFGAPSVKVNGELFWGDDRLEDAFEFLVQEQRR